MKNEWPQFDQLMKIAEQQPEQLEAFRKREVEALISSAPKSMQRRLRGLQFQIDCKRETHKSPMGSCIEISKMMYESLDKLNAVLNGKTYLNGAYSEPEREEKADILQFPIAG